MRVGHLLFWYEGRHIKSLNKNEQMEKGEKKKEKPIKMPRKKISREKTIFVQFRFMFSIRGQLRLELGRKDKIGVTIQRNYLKRK